MSVTSLFAIVFVFVFVSYAVWVLSYAFAHDKDDKGEASIEEMVDDLRNSFSYSA